MHLTHALLQCALQLHIHWVTFGAARDVVRSAAMTRVGVTLLGATAKYEAAMGAAATGARMATLKVRWSITTECTRAQCCDLISARGCMNSLVKGVCNKSILNRF